MKNHFTKYLDLAQAYANAFSGCTKVQVGSIIIPQYSNGILICGANRAVPSLCKYRGCLRMEKYGDNSKEHRNPADCRAIHSEIDAICNAAKQGISLQDATIYITRYPCEACARAIANAGITQVIYGREGKISEDTRKIFDIYNIDYYQVIEWSAPDDNS